MALNLKTETSFLDDRPPAPPPLPPEQIAPHFPQLEILECLGRGGMGVVYKARQKSLNRLVALKLLAPERAGDPQFAARFEKEARALAALNHPNIVTIYDHGQAGGSYYLLMEFVDGVTLRQLLAKERVAPREALAIVPQICDALQFAHDQGIVHRDIKPENILLDRRGRVKVADFGLAKIVGQASRLSLNSDTATLPSGQEKLETGATPVLQEPTDAGKVMGTPQYMSPEQITAPGEVDHRADIYALGVVFYQMLTGELPGKQLQPPSTKVHIDVRLDEVVLRALEKKPELRYQQASALKTEVETIATETGGADAAPKLLKPEAEHLKREISALARRGPGAFAKTCALWIADQALLLFDFTATVNTHTEVGGKRRLNFWPLLLLFCSSIGFLVNGGIVILNLVQRFSHGQALGLTMQETNMLIWAVIFGVGRLAALNLGAGETPEGERTPVTRAITAKRVGTAGRRLLLLVALSFASWLVTWWLIGLSDPAQAKAAVVARWTGFIILGGLVATALAWYAKLLVHVQAEVKKRQAQTANSNPLPTLDFWQALEAGDYSRAWDKTAPYLQRDFSREKWVSWLEEVRRPLGKSVSRQQLSQVFLNPGVRFIQTVRTTFDSGKAATETVVCAVQHGGEWRVEKYELGRPEAAAAPASAPVPKPVRPLRDWERRWQALPREFRRLTQVALCLAAVALLVCFLQPDRITTTEGKRTTDTWTFGAGTPWLKEVKVFGPQQQNWRELSARTGSFAAGGVSLLLLLALAALANAERGTPGHLLNVATPPDRKGVFRLGRLLLVTMFFLLLAANLVALTDALMLAVLGGSPPLLLMLFILPSWVLIPVRRLLAITYHRPAPPGAGGMPAPAGPTAPPNLPPLTATRRPLPFAAAVITALIVWLLVTFGAAVVTFMMPESYQGVARIKVNRDEEYVTPGGVPRPYYDPYFIQTEFEVLQSQLVLGRVVKDLDLNTVWGRKYKGGQRLTEAESQQVLRSCLELRPVRNTRLIEIRVSRDSPDEAARIANAIAKAYQGFRKEQHRQMLTATKDKVQAQLDALDAQILDSKKARSQLREALRIDMDSGESATIDADRVEEYRVDVCRRLIGVSNLVAALTNLPTSQLRAVLADTASATNASISNLLAQFSYKYDGLLGEFLQQLSLAEQTLSTNLMTYGATHPETTRCRAIVEDLSRKMNERVKDRIASLEQRLAELRAEENRLVTTLVEDKAMKARSQKYWDKKRELDEMVNARQVLELKLRGQQVELAVPSTDLVQIVDRATPTLRPSRPNKPLNIAIGAMGGAVAGLLAGGLVLLVGALRRSWIPVAPVAAKPSRFWGRFAIVAAVMLLALMFVAVATTLLWIATRPSAHGQAQFPAMLTSRQPSPAATAEAPEAIETFGPVIERVVNDGADGFGKDMYLDLDTSRLMSYPRDQHFSDPNLGRQWMATNGLDVQAINQVRAWTNGMAEAADKVFFEQCGQHLPAGPLKGIFISDATTLRLDGSQWDSLTPDALTAALAPQPSNAIGYYSAAGELPVTLGFKTREGGRGILQITGFTENPRGVKLRYKLVQNGSKQNPTKAVAASWTDSIRLKQIIAPGETGTGRYGDEAFDYEIIFSPESVALTVTHRAEEGFAYQVQIEDKSGARRRLAGSGLVTTTKPDAGHRIVAEKLMLSRKEFEQIATLVLQKKDAPPQTASTALGSATERAVSPKDVDSQGLLFLDLERNRAFQPPMPVRFAELTGLEMNPALADWLRTNRIDLLVCLVPQTKVAGSEQTLPGAHLRGVNLSGVVVLDEAAWNEAAGNPSAKPWQSLDPELTVSDSRLLGQSARPYHAFLRTLDGSLFALEASSDGKPADGVKLRFKQMTDTRPAAAAKPIPPEAVARWAATQEWFRETEKQLKPNDPAAYAAMDKEFQARSLAIKEMIRGTVVEPLSQQQEAAAERFRAATAAKDAAGAKSAVDEVDRLRIQIEELFRIAVEAELAKANSTFQFRWVAAAGDTNSPADVLPDASDPKGQRQLRVLRPVVLSEHDVDSAGFTKYQAEQKELAVFLNPRGGEKFAKATAENIGRQLAIVWHGRVLSAPVVRAAITGRRMNINGRFSDAEAQALLDVLNNRSSATNAPAK